jgi:hypothetical protein
MNTKIVFFDRADKTWAHTLSKQMFPETPSFIPQVMQWLSVHKSSPYDMYVVIDTNTKTKLPMQLAVRTDILPDKETNLIQPVYFIPK